MAGSNRGERRRRIVLAALLSTVVTTTSLTVVLVPRPAGADQIADLRARALAISQKLVQDQLEVDTFEQQYSVASQKVAADTQTISAVSQQIGQDVQHMGQETTLVRQQALTSYMSADDQLSGSDAVLFAGNEVTVQVTNEYATVAAGNVETTLDQLRTTQHALVTQRATLQSQQRQDQAEQMVQAGDLGQAQSTEAQLASLQSQVTGQLAQAVAQQAAAEAAAAAAAVAAARRAQAATVRKTSAPSPSGPAPNLNAYLQCVVQAESGGNYGAVSPNGMYMGAFQFSQATWNAAAQAIGRSDLVGVRPNLASPADQNAVAIALYALDGEQPWLGDRCS